MFDRRTWLLSSLGSNLLTRFEGWEWVWVETWNENPKPFVWTKTADQILKALAGYCAAVNK